MFAQFLRGETIQKATKGDILRAIGVGRIVRAGEKGRGGGAEKRQRIQRLHGTFIFTPLVESAGVNEALVLRAVSLHPFGRDHQRFGECEIAARGKGIRNRAGEKENQRKKEKTQDNAPPGHLPQGAVGPLLSDISVNFVTIFHRGNHP